MNCPYCKTKLADGSQFCSNCGQTISRSVEQSSAYSSYWRAVEKEVARDEKIRIDAENEFLQKQKKKNRIVIAFLIAFGIIGVIIFYYVSIYPSQQYNVANELLNSGEYHESMAIFEKLGNYKDSVEQIIKCQNGITEQRYLDGIAEYQGGNYREALLIFEELGSYKDCQSLKYDCSIQIVQSIAPVYHWDFSANLSEQNGLSTTAHGNTGIKKVLNGSVESAVYFDGDGDYIECGRGINLTEDFTFSVLLCCQEVYKDYSAFFAKFEENGGPYAFSINQGRVNLWITDEDGYYTEIESVTEIRNNEWYAISIVKDGENFKLYINGQLDSEDTISSVSTGEDLVTIGRQALMFFPEDQLQFTGYIGDISIYEQTLSSDEILALYESKLAIPSNGEITITADIPEGALNWNSHYYFVFDNCKSWEEAAEYCESRGGHLATITSADENVAVFSFVNQSGYESAYLGLSDSVNEGTWSWITGESTDFLNWHSGEPNGESSTEDYAMFYYKFSDGTWNDGEFGSGTSNGGTAFICEWD